MKVGVLGPLAIEVDGVSRRIGSPQRRALLALLALESNKQIPVERLVAGVWGERAPRHATKNIQVHVCQLRKVLGTRLRSHAGGYGLDVTVDDALDVAEFATLVRAARDARQSGERIAATAYYGVALTRWRGPALADIVGAGLLGTQAQRLDSWRSEVVREWAETALMAGDQVALDPPLTDLVDRFPLDEHLCEALMVMRRRDGRLHDALAVYDRCAAVLAGQLGSAPSRPLRAAAAAIRRELAAWSRDTGRTHVRHPVRRVPLETSPPPAERQVRQLPPDLPDFVTRPTLAQVVAAATSRGSAPIVVNIVGPGGSGKTSLAVRAAHQLAPMFCDGQLYADLQSSAPGDASRVDIVGRFLRALGVAADRVPSDEDEASALYRSLVADRALLVLIDDATFEKDVRAVLPAGPRSLTLVTSRRMLGGLSGARRVNAGMFSPWESQALLRNIVGHARVEREPDSASELLDRCDHLPLAVRVAGARLAGRPTWRINDFLAALGDGSRCLDQLRAGDLDVRPVIAAAFDALPPGDRRLARRLSWHPGPTIDVESSAVLIGEPDSAAREGLARLVEAQVVAHAAENSYWMLNLARACAAELADAEEPPSEWLAALGRLAASRRQPDG